MNPSDIQKITFIIEDMPNGTTQISISPPINILQRMEDEGINLSLTQRYALYIARAIKYIEPQMKSDTAIKYPQ